MLYIIDWIFIAISILFTLGVFFGFTGNFVSNRRTRPYPDYEEYETPSWVEIKWYETKLIGRCDVCGMDDLPPVTFLIGSHYCRWCAELSYLQRHLKEKGHRKVNV